MPFFITSDHRLEKLAESYLGRRQADARAFRPAGGILSTETVIVPTRGIATWLEQRMVKAGVVVMGFDFPVLLKGFRQLLHTVVPEFDATALVTPEEISWQLYYFLTTGRQALAPEEREVYASLFGYIDRETGDNRLRRCYQFARKMGSLFAQYQSYLPRTMAAWAKGESLDRLLDKTPGKGDLLDGKYRWQSHLWHWVVANTKTADGMPKKCLAGAFAEFLDTLEVPDGVSLPPVTLFGITVVPPVYLQVLAKYSDLGGTVNLFYHNPCREFFGDNRSRWQQRRDARMRARESASETLDEYLDYQNELLADYGRQAQEFFNTLLDLGMDPSPTEAEEESPRESLLGRVQQLVLENRDPDEDERMTLSACDDSLTIHPCHNVTREVEVLRDQLLLLLKRRNRLDAFDRNYRLSDIIVMAPDISEFAPVIREVFDESPLKGLYAITDRTIQQNNLLASAFLGILELVDANFEVSRVHALLDCSPLCAAFGLTEEQVEECRRWLAETGVCFGFSGVERKENFGTDAETADRLEGGTWLQALDRMLLGVAMELPIEQASRAPAFAGLMANPVSDADALGKLAALTHCLHDKILAIRAKRARTAAQWRECLAEVLETFFRRNFENAQDFIAIQHALAEFSQAVEQSPVKDEPLPFPLLCDIVRELLSRPTEAGQADPFLGGRITCCSMIPMRGVPCKVMALLGMDDGAFPRQDLQQGFSLVNDANLLPFFTRSKANEDRNLFLEALMAPSDTLLLFYQGFDEESGEPLEPSPVIAQLRDYLEQKLLDDLTGEGTKTSHDLICTHRLNDFDPKNFRSASSQPASSLKNAFSFDAAAASIANFASAQPSDPAENNWLRELPTSVPEALAEADEVRIALAELERFFKDYVALFEEHALRLNREYDDSVAVDSDREVIAPNALQEYLLLSKTAEVLRKEYADAALHEDGTLADEHSFDIPLDRLQKRLVAENALPIGDAGELFYNDCVRRIALAPDNGSLQALKEYSLAEETPLEVRGTLSDGRKYVVTGGARVFDSASVCYLIPSGREIKTKYKFNAYLRQLLYSLQSGKATQVRLLNYQCHLPLMLFLPGGQDSWQAALDAIADEFLLTYQRPRPIFPDLIWLFGHDKKHAPEGSADWKKAITTLEGTGRNQKNLRNQSLGILPEEVRTADEYVEEFLRLAYSFFPADDDMAKA